MAEEDMTAEEEAAPPAAQVLRTVEYCTSCGARLLGTGFTVFPCPNCLENEIARCVKCRRLGNVYRCDKCGFEGP